MHKTTADEKRKALQKKALKLAMQSKATLKDWPDGRTSPWTMEKVKSSKKGSRTHYYWMATWREGAVPEMCTWGAVPGWMRMQLCRRPKP